VEFTVVKDEADFSFVKIARSLTKGQKVEDCINLGTKNWFGGPQRRFQYWPIQSLNFTDLPYVTQENQNIAIAERYWLSSEGVFFYVDPATPLYISQTPNEELCLAAEKAMPYYTYDTAFTFIYHIGVSTNARTAHMKAVQHVLNKPTGRPAERMMRYPFWSTWARYKVDINDSVVRTFADEILANKFQNSQIEIDDNWEVCYGALTFSESKFPDIKALTDHLNSLGFMVTLWIHPFINKGCEPWYSEAKGKGYFVLGWNGSPDTQWWNSKTGEAAYIDFTKPEAAQWFSDRLKALQVSAGIDSYKFDAGESSWSPPDPVLQGDNALRPSLITSAYVRTVAKFGNLVEVRSGQNTQDLPIFVRMIDKDSEWGLHNGLQTLITTLLQMNMAGYPLVLPDMIGGNGYDNHPPNKELFLRWLAANVFMPSLQFSYVPWDYDTEAIEISRMFVELHGKYTYNIVTRFRLAVANGDPVNPPVWWIDPTDSVAQTIADRKDCKRLIHILS
jgi:myogenesis-regulating glycosidase